MSVRKGYKEIMTNNDKMPNYSKALIYTIRTGDSVYVGSTCNFRNRKYHHSCSIYNENTKRYNNKLYQNIRKNDGEWVMKPHKEFPCENITQLSIEEERVRVELNADLNGRKCFITNVELKERDKLNIKIWKNNNINHVKNYAKVYRKQYYEKNKEALNLKSKEKVICDCGCEVRKSDIARHKKSDKHIKLMESKMGK